MNENTLVNQDLDIISKPIAPIMQFVVTNLLAFGFLITVLYTIWIIIDSFRQEKDKLGYIFKKTGIIWLVYGLLYAIVQPSVLTNIIGIITNSTTKLFNTIKK